MIDNWQERHAPHRGIEDTHGWSIIIVFALEVSRELERNGAAMWGQ